MAGWVKPTCRAICRCDKPSSCKSAINRSRTQVSLASDTARPPLRDPLQSHLNTTAGEPYMVPDLRRIPAVIVEVHNPPIPLSRTHRRLRRPRTTRLQGPVTADLIRTTSRHVHSMEWVCRYLSEIQARELRQNRAAE
jgi:hypothetical protein